MRRVSLVQAKAHLSELVDAAEHRGARVLILRHGVPAAAIVPVDVAERAGARVRRPRRLSRKAFDELLDRLTPSRRSKSTAKSIDELLGRGRLDDAI